MYRQYENPAELERLIELEVQRQHDVKLIGGELDEYDYFRLQELQDRLNFAYQDQEYDENNAEVF